MTACFQASFLFAKLAIASLNCNFPYDAVEKPLQIFLNVSQRACGSSDSANWPGTEAGGQAFYSDVKGKGRTRVCNRIHDELTGRIK